MYSEKHHRLHLVEETFWIKNCWKLHMRSTPKQCIGLSFSYLFVPQVSGFGSVINGLLMQCSCCYMGFCSSSGLPTSHFSNSVPILIRIIQGIISPEKFRWICMWYLHMRTIPSSQLRAVIISLWGKQRPNLVRFLVQLFDHPAVSVSYYKAAHVTGITNDVNETSRYAICKIYKLTKYLSLHYLL